jgi:hypothetical protein
MLFSIKHLPDSWYKLHLHGQVIWLHHLHKYFWKLQRDIYTLFSSCNNKNWTCCDNTKFSLWDVLWSFQKPLMNMRWIERCVQETMFGWYVGKYDMFQMMELEYICPCLNWGSMYIYYNVSLKIVGIWRLLLLPNWQRINRILVLSNDIGLCYKYCLSLFIILCDCNMQ